MATEPEAVPLRIKWIIPKLNYFNCTDRHLNLDLLAQNINSTLMCGLEIFARPPIYNLPGNVISATVDLVYINLRPEYELPNILW